MKLLTEEQRDLYLMVHDFVENELIPISKDYDISGEVPLNTYKKAFDMGLHCVNVPEQFGGAGLDLTTTAMLFEEIARGDAGFAVSLVTMIFGIETMLMGASDDQIQTFLDIVVPGAFSGFALTEPGAGSDAGGLRTTAMRSGDEYVINGTKCFITNATYADVFIVFASTDPTQHTKGISAFLVERNREGVSSGTEENKMGCRLSNTADVVFRDVKVPADHLIGKEGDGFKLAMRSLNHSRPVVGAMACGISDAAITHAVQYAQQRVQFGKPISKLQGIQFLIADMESYREASRQLVFYATKMADAGLPFVKESAMSKYIACDSAVKITTDAVQIFGGYGYSKEYPVEKLMRDAKVFQIFEGTNQIQRLTVASQMLSK